mmetsp:Transcript_3550/g.6878  ORF Transcript_3550/g.6878 Transcript_3550/m.6878 type:complete len:143 (-) Transcript_3550:134-562(-)
MEGSELETVRTAAQQAGFEWKHPSGAAILLYPNQYESILSGLSLHELRPHHVLITEAFLPLLFNEICKIPSRANIRPSSLRPVALASDDDKDVAIVEKTFYNFDPALLHDTASVTQSLTDARHGVNHRRKEPGLVFPCCLRR